METMKEKLEAHAKNFGNTPILRELFRQQGNENKSKN